MQKITMAELKAAHDLFFKPSTLKSFGVKKNKIFKSERLGAYVYVEKNKMVFSDESFEITYTARKINKDLSFDRVERFKNITALNIYIGKNINL